MKIKNILLNNFGLKLLALFMAFITWLYVGELTKFDSDKTILRKLFEPSSYSAKELSIRPVFVKAVPEGYKFIDSEVKVIPESTIFIGPQTILSKKEFIYTKPIDLSEHTKTKIIDVELEDISPSIILQKIKVQVSLVIEKTEVEKIKE